MTMSRIAAVVLLIGIGFAVAGVGQEVAPVEIITLALPILPVDQAEEQPPIVAEGVLTYPEDCGYCYMGQTQFALAVPEGMTGLRIQLTNTTDPDGDIDLVIRVDRPATEDESTFYYDYRTFGTGGVEELLLPEEGFDEISAGTYYVGVIGYVEAGANYEVRAAGYVEEILPEARVLEPNVAIEESLAAMSVSGDGETQYRVDVPPQAELLAIHAFAHHGDVDLYLGTRPVQRRMDGTPIAEMALAGRGIEELLLLRDPAATTFWAVVANPTHDAIRFELTAMTLPVVVDVDDGATVHDTAGYEGGLIERLAGFLATADGLVSPTQYRIEIPSDATGAIIRLNGPDCCELGLHVRYGEPIRVIDGVVHADLSLLNGTEKQAVLRGAFLQPGAVVYVAMERLGDVGEKAFSLSVEIET